MILVPSQLNLNDNLHFCGSFILILNGLILCSSKPLILTELRIFLPPFLIPERFSRSRITEMFMITRVQAKLELFKLSTSDIINDRITFIQSKVYFLDSPY